MLILNWKVNIGNSIDFYPNKLDALQENINSNIYHPEEFETKQKMYENTREMNDNGIHQVT